MKTYKPYIYVIIDNKYNKVCYVGKHNGTIKNYTTSGKVLKRYISIFGLDAFLIRFSKKVIEYCTLETYDIREEYWIKYFDTYNNGMNKTMGGTFDIKYRLPKLKPVNQYTLDGTFVKQWASMREAEIFLGIPRGRISDVCKGKQQSTRGWIFRTIDNNDKVEWKRKDYSKRTTSPNSKPVIYQGKSYPSQIECCRQNNITEKRLRSYLKKLK